MFDPNDLRTVMNQCRVELTGASDAMLKSMMYEVMDEFFRDTNSWREEVVFNVAPPAQQPQNPQQHQKAVSYPIAVSEGQIIRLDGVINVHRSFVGAIMPHIGTVVLSHIPNEPQQYTAFVTKNVSLPLTKDGFPIGPEWLLKKWHLAIKCGIVGNLMNQKNKSYSDSKGALYNLQKFRQFVANVRSAVLRANTSGASAWRFPQQFRSISQKGGVPVYATGNEWSG
jgi:hypothetical protein